MSEEPHQPSESNTYEVLGLALQESIGENEYFTVSISPTKWGFAELDIKYIVSKYDDEDSFDYYYRQLRRSVDDILKDFDMEIIDFGGMGIQSETWRVYPRTVNGKINWRRWLYFPEKFSDDNKELLDEGASFTEINDLVDQCNGDKLSKFTFFVGQLRLKGLINDEEKKNLEEQYHDVAHA